MNYLRRPGAAAIAMIALLQTAACDDTCSSDIARTLASPDGGFKAVLFNRDCGATTDFSSNISILRTDEALSGRGNVFAADANHGAATRGPWGGPNVDMHWTSPTDLTVKYATGARRFVEKTAFNGITITYEAGDFRDASPRP